MHGDEQWGVPGYSAVRELGSGSAGRVVLARRDHDGAEVAVKYLSDQLRYDVGFVARFRHEARLLATLRSPYNARLIDYVETGSGAAIVMELVNGVSLRQLLRSEGPTGPEAALTVLKGSLKGLAAAHAIGVVHRDFKPENVVVQGDGVSKLVDFGIAVRAGEGGSAAGTPPYMAPEQWSGAPAAPATDVYAATVVFFECLTGARPFRASNVAALARQHQSVQPPVEEVPAALRGLVERGMAKNAAERPPSAEAFLTELEAVAAEAYGPDWEERGRRRLARLAGLLALLFPSTPEAPAETQTSLAETTFDEPSSLLAKLSSKILIGAVCVGLLVGVTMVAVNAFDDTALRAQSSEVTPTTAAPATLEPADDTTDDTTDGPTDEPTDDVPEETDEPTASPTGPPSDDPAPQPTTSASVAVPVATTKSPTPKPSKSPSRRPTPTPARTTEEPAPSESPAPDITGTVDDPPTTQVTSRAPSPSPSRSTASPRPDPSPSTTTPTGTPTPTIDDNGPGTPRAAQPDGGTPAPETGETAVALLAAGLVTSGTVPVTLAVKRRMAGRHRRKR
ncbi:serine/threonine-protein kinase [Nonomuraea muscovyensis]|uniref:non-specific serine/threonine protein kinase n=1 Tax=Nonomuraea muscovyensis TaxID=1124761 RepID=A0A7X0CBW8_9ACTN|nr:serine/threonine-protein kinase [Nonomuraea muscovyensis]MBB6351286.1 serine/threonine-protein kinase [Nonomuraea muscovyensis]